MTYIYDVYNTLYDLKSLIVGFVLHVLQIAKLWWVFDWYVFVEYWAQNDLLELAHPTLH